MQKIFPVTHKNTKIQLRHIEGNLQIQNWDRPEIQVTVSGEARIFWQERQTIFLQDSSGDVSIMIPKYRAFFFHNHIDLDVEDVQQHVTIEQIDDARLSNIEGMVKINDVRGDLSAAYIKETVQIKNVGGDVEAQSLPRLLIQHIGSDLQTQNVQKVEVTNVGGDAQVRDTHVLTIQSVGGDLNAEQVREQICVQNVGGDAEVSDSTNALMEIRHVGGDFNCSTTVKALSTTVGGDLKIAILGQIDTQTKLTAGGDAKIIIAPESNLNVQMIAGGKIRTKDAQYSRYGSNAQFNYGEGQGKLSVTAGGDIILYANTPSNSEEFPFSKYNWREIEGHWQEMSKDLQHMGKELAKEFHRTFGA